MLEVSFSLREPQDAYTKFYISAYVEAKAEQGGTKAQFSHLSTTASAYAEI